MWWTTWPKFIGLKIWNKSLIFCLHEDCIAGETMQWSLNLFLSFNAWWNGGYATKPPSLEVEDGGYRKRPPSFWEYGGSCSSKIVLAVSLIPARAFHIELEFGNVGFWGEGKTGVPGEKPLGARREPTTNSSYIWRRVRESNPGYISGRRNWRGVEWIALGRGEGEEYSLNFSRPYPSPLWMK